jgi:hypothetical protein
MMNGKGTHNLVPPPGLIQVITVFVLENRDLIFYQMILKLTFEILGCQENRSKMVIFN